MMGRDKKSYPDFPGWQVGYGAFTYHISMKPVLINYVFNQELHHKGITFNLSPGDTGAIGSQCRRH